MPGHSPLLYHLRTIIRIGIHPMQSHPHLEGTFVAEKCGIIHPMLQAHFRPTPLDSLVVTERLFPARVRADLQRAIDTLVGRVKVCHFCAVRGPHGPMMSGMSDLLVRNVQFPIVTAPPQYEEVDVGEKEPLRCLKGGLWLLEEGGA